MDNAKQEKMITLIWFLCSYKNVHRIQFMKSLRQDWKETPRTHYFFHCDENKYCNWQDYGNLFSEAIVRKEARRVVRLIWNAKCYLIALPSQKLCFSCCRIPIKIVGEFPVGRLRWRACAGEIQCLFALCSHNCVILYSFV